jgi:hypothetical protein
LRILKQANIDQRVAQMMDQLENQSVENKSLENNIAELCKHIREAAEKSQRNAQSIKLLAVSKTRSAAEVREAYQAGLHAFGENYLQEALDKQLELNDLAIEWHFIGAAQSNKTRPIAEHFDWFHTLDRIKIAQRLNDQRPVGKAPLNCCIQVNINNEESKAGVACEDVIALAKAVQGMPQLKLRGLMAIPEATSEYKQQRENFAKLASLLRQLQNEFALGGLDQEQLDTLSIGMSGDMDAAIAEGSTIVRIGTALFGPRATKPTPTQP